MLTTGSAGSAKGRCKETHEIVERETFTADRQPFARLTAYNGEGVRHCAELGQVTKQILFGYVTW